MTIPSTVKYIGSEAFLSGPADLFFDDMPILRENPTGVQNMYILSKDAEYIERSNTGEEDGEGGIAIGGGSGLPVFCDYTTKIHGYAGSTIEAWVNEYNTKILEDEEQLLSLIAFYYLAEGDHTFGEYVKVDENNHHRICQDDGCDAEEICPHSLVIDVDTCVAQTCETDGKYRMYCTACDYVGEFIKIGDATGHDLTGGISDKDEEQHWWLCWNCGEYVYEAHDWLYTPDTNAVEPYEVDATCSVCGHEKKITVIPEGTTVIKVEAEDENGEAAELPEDAFTVSWQDREGTEPV